MKKDIHPEKHPVCFVDISTNKEFITNSTLTSGDTRVIDGVEHYVVSCDVTADSHPAYTGQERLVDTAGRIDKFTKRFGDKGNLASKRKKKKNK